MALRMLLEGNSVRATGRLLGMDKKTILSLMADVGNRCDKFLRTAVAPIACKSVQCDEVWSYVLCKEKTRVRKAYDAALCGDCYTWTAIEPASKFLLAYAVGKRDNATCAKFVRRLRRATLGTFQIDTDGLALYRSVLPLAFGYYWDHAQIVKIFARSSDGEAKYSPAPITGMHVEVGSGNPNLATASTSYIERSNKTLRMQIRRFTRLTDGHSKRWKNHEAAIALFIAYYNFCRVHSTVKTTPAVAAGLADHTWTVQELLNATSSVY